MKTTLQKFQRFELIACRLLHAASSETLPQDVAHIAMYQWHFWTDNADF